MSPPVSLNNASNRATVDLLISSNSFCTASTFLCVLLLLGIFLLRFLLPRDGSTVDDRRITKALLAAILFSSVPIKLRHIPRSSEHLALSLPHMSAAGIRPRTRSSATDKTVAGCSPCKSPTKALLAAILFSSVPIKLRHIPRSSEHLALSLPHMSAAGIRPRTRSSATDKTVAGCSPCKSPLTACSSWSRI